MLFGSSAVYELNKYNDFLFKSQRIIFKGGKLFYNDLYYHGFLVRFANDLYYHGFLVRFAFITFFNPKGFYALVAGLTNPVDT